MTSKMMLLLEGVTSFAEILDPWKAEDQAYLYVGVTIDHLEGNPKEDFQD